jgi:hypothetical protein
MTSRYNRLTSIFSRPFTTMKTLNMMCDTCGQTVHSSNSHCEHCGRLRDMLQKICAICDKVTDNSSACYICYKPNKQK